MSFLPWQPESLESAKGRFHQALQEPWKEENIWSETPREHPLPRRNTFHFEDGMVMIALKVIHPVGGPYLMLQFGFDEASGHEFNEQTVIERIRELRLAFAGTLDLIDEFKGQGRYAEPMFWARFLL